jgi:hypothetical protein
MRRQLLWAQASSKSLAIGTNVVNARWFRRRKVSVGINIRRDTKEGAGKVSNWCRIPGAGSTAGFDYSAFRHTGEDMASKEPPKLQERVRFLPPVPSR